MDEKRLDGLKRSYFALFFLALIHIAVFSLSALTDIWWLSSLFEVGAICAVLWVAHASFTCKGVPIDYDIGWKPNKTSLLFLLFLPFFVGLVILLSRGTAALGNMVGYDATYDFGDRVWVCLVASALLPSIIEEVFCRFIILPRLSVYSRMGGVLASALFFALLHGDFVQIPYAFVAGVMLGILALCCKSIFPCILFHFVNNVASILLHFYADTLLPTILIYLLLGSMLVCAVGIVLFRRPILSALSVLGKKDEEEPLKAGTVVGRMFTSPLIILMGLFLLDALLSLLQAVMGG